MSSAMMNISSSSDATCDAVLESSEMCVAIRDEEDMGSITCGKWELQTNQNLWYLGDIDGLFNIISSPQDVQGHIDKNISLQTAVDGCDDPSMINTNTNFTYNYLRPCGGNSGFGGFDIMNGQNDTMCNEDEQEIELECDALTDCTDLRVCCYDYRYIYEEL
eukprot:330880_1